MKHRKENGTYLSLRKFTVHMICLKLKKPIKKIIPSLNINHHKLGLLFWLQRMRGRKRGVIQFWDFHGWLQSSSPKKDLHIICNAHCYIRTKISLEKSSLTGHAFYMGKKPLKERGHYKASKKRKFWNMKTIFKLNSQINYENLHSETVR